MVKMVRTQTPLLQNFKIAMKELDGMTTKVGWLDTNKYEGGMSVAYVAAIMEFGAPSRRIPARPMIRPTQTARAAAWTALMESGCKAVLRGGVTAYQVMEAVGLQAVGDIQHTISTITEPPLSIITLLARKHRKEHGRQSVTGATIGKLAADAKKDNVDVSGVSTKPLNDTGLMMASVISITTSKGS